MTGKKRKVLLVTGLSGAGLSTALKALEDLGYKVVDNLPLSLVTPLLGQKEGRQQPVAIGIDSRTWGFSAEGLLQHVAALAKNKALAVQLLFMDCQATVLQQRFTETRRLHPLAIDRPVADGVAREQQLMRPVKKNADIVIDTSELKAHELRRLLEGHFRLTPAPGLVIAVTSFGFRNGLPREADLVFDVRFLDNPHWDPRLRSLSGLDRAVAQKIRGDAAFKKFSRKLEDLLNFLVPRYDHEGKAYLTIAIGCTGGRHRSVFVAEEIARRLVRQGYSASVRHRDLAGWGARQYAAAEDGETKNKQSRRKK